MRSIAVVQTDHAARYMGQLVKHFAHKLPTALEEGRGQITFPIGVCDVEAGDVLTLTCAAEPQQIEQLQDVVARHLARFAFRENGLQVHWGVAEA